jgi:GT2 family glycosyltransferase
MTPAIIICTLNRPRELRACLQSVEKQELRPAFVIVVDSSDPEAFGANADAVRCLADRSGVEVRHLHAKRGLASQRNAGIEALRAAGIDALRAGGIDWVQFLDDDVELLPDYLAAVDKYFADRHVVGVEGADRNQIATPRGVFRVIYPRLRSGSCLSKTGHNWFPQSTSACSVDWLSGCAPAYRRSALDGAAFDERRTGVGHGEDVDFSFRIGQLGRLVYDPGAGYVHRPSALNRAFGADLAHDVVVHRRTLSHDFKDTFGPAWVRYGFLVEALWTFATAAVHRSAQQWRYAQVLLRASYRRREHILDRAMN